MTFHRRSIELTNGWEFKAEHGDDTRVKALPLPTTIHQDLLANKLIPDPFLAKNEEAVQWIGERVWTYRTTFTVPEDIQSQHDLIKTLVFEGLDTYATVRLNGKRILEADNMFLSHRVDITNLLEPHGDLNYLEIAFDIAECRGNAEVEKHPEHGWLTFDSGGHARLATRKAQYHYGWDWGPKLMTCGPWRPIYLELSQSRISDVYVRTHLSDDLKVAQLDVTVEGTASFARVDLIFNGTVVASSYETKRDQTFRISITIHDPKLWWPHTLGGQDMYDVAVSLYPGSESTDSPSDTITKRIGIRKVSLVRQPFSSQEGSSFFFKINNVSIFCSGSNWIPGDSFLPRISSADYYKWIKMVKNSNQVMIRVWGGGIYEHQSFYDACDEMGLMVWQDFMFACGMSPAYETFLQQVEAEAKDNVRKLRHHPSIVIWCGNNEDYVIPLLSNIEYDRATTSKEAIISSPFPARWTYEDLLPDICTRLTPDTPYWPGSPFGGEMVNSVKEGDCHQWHVWHLEKYPYQTFPSLTARFVSEFGMQGMPNFRTVSQFFPSGSDLAKRKDWTEDEYIAFHNKCGGGPETLHQYCDDNLPNFETAKTNLNQLIYYTQLVQSETAGWAYSSWRRDWKGLGKEYCGGALIWQLNDCWPVTSWALIDSHFRPKMAYWTMKRENAPITAGLRRYADENGTIHLEAWIVNMTLKDIDVDVVLRAWNVAGGDTTLSKNVGTALISAANQSTELDSIVLKDLPINSANGYKDVVFALDITNRSSSFKAQAINFHEPFQEVPFSQPKTFTAHIISSQGKSSVRLNSSSALKGVLLDTVTSDPKADEVEWEDNGFDMLPNEAVEVAVTGLQQGEESRLHIRWLGGEWRCESFASVKANL